MHKAAPSPAGSPCPGPSVDRLVAGHVPRGGRAAQQPDHRHRRLLRARRERPRGCRATEQRYELAPLHSWPALTRIAVSEIPTEMLGHPTVDDAVARHVADAWEGKVITEH
jgi:hypothetical protein